MQGSEIVIPDWLWLVFLFASGGCVGSFLNVVVYRIPRDKSLVFPPSSCPACGKHIRFYDNIPIVSWLLLLGRCRYCRARISPRYFVIELLTALVFVGIFLLYFRSGLRGGIPSFMAGGWFLYLTTIILLSTLVACSAIDLELWIIPLSVCWFASIAGIVASAIAPLVIHPATIRHYFLLPTTAALVFVNQTTVASLTTGALIGLGMSLILLATGLIKRSYDIAGLKESNQNSEQQQADLDDTQNAAEEFNDRVEMVREVVFLLPIIAFAIGAHWLVGLLPKDLYQSWAQISQMPVISGLLGSLAGYFVGCGFVWGARILFTLIFGREAMGLGDVHLMGAAGTIIGPVFVIITFFVAPFFGLIWAGFQMLFKKTRQIPYGPFLSLGILTVILLQDRIVSYFKIVFGR
ncbi:MAG: prepilin peptidase [Sedimentisphaerales bacterium]|nr:prepilin peptidase [Sedimentisphaerales bacterium]